LGRPIQAGKGIAADPGRSDGRLCREGGTLLSTDRLSKAFAMSRSASSGPNHQSGTSGANPAAILARSPLSGHTCRTSDMTQAWIACCDTAQARRRRR
jgi:hypothetical protein